MLSGKAEGEVLLQKWSVHSCQSELCQKREIIQVQKQDHGEKTQTVKTSETDKTIWNRRGTRV